MELQFQVPTLAPARII